MDCASRRRGSGLDDERDEVPPWASLPAEDARKGAEDGTRAPKGAAAKAVRDVPRQPPDAIRTAPAHMIAGAGPGAVAARER